MPHIVATGESTEDFFRTCGIAVSVDVLTEIGKNGSFLAEIYQELSLSRKAPGKALQLRLRALSKPCQIAPAATRADVDESIAEACVAIAGLLSDHPDPLPWAQAASEGIASLVKLWLFAENRAEVVVRLRQGFERFHFFWLQWALEQEQLDCIPEILLRMDRRQPAETILLRRLRYEAPMPPAVRAYIARFEELADVNASIRKGLRQGLHVANSHDEDIPNSTFGHRSFRTSSDTDRQLAFQHAALLKQLSALRSAASAEPGYGALAFPLEAAAIEHLITALDSDQGLLVLLDIPLTKQGRGCYGVLLITATEAPRWIPIARLAALASELSEAKAPPGRAERNEGWFSPALRQRAGRLSALLWSRLSGVVSGLDQLACMTYGRLGFEFLALEAPATIKLIRYSDMMSFVSHQGRLSREES